MMKAAFATWHERIAPLFDTSRHAHLLEVLPGCIPIERREYFSGESPVQNVLRLVEWEVDTLVCGAISRPLQAIVMAHGIQIIAFVSGDLREVMDAWLDGHIHDLQYAMPGYRNRKYQ
jgi:hypothetical protein